MTIAALRQAGTHPRDRIEHAAVAPLDCLTDLAELVVTVTTQPNFVAERGDQYLDEVPCAGARRTLAGGVAASGRRAGRLVHRYAVRPA